MICTWEADRGQGTNNSSEGETRSGPLLWLCHFRVSQPQTRSGRGLVYPQCTWVASWTNAPKSSMQSAKHITTLSLGTTILVLWVLKAVVSLPPESAKETHIAPWSGQADKTNPIDVPRASPSPGGKGLWGMLGRGGRRGITTFWVPGAILIASHESRQGRWSQQIEDLLSNR